LAAVRCAARLQITALDDRLERLANTPSEPPELRRVALRAVAQRRVTLGPESFGLIVADVSHDADPLLRLAAAEVLGKSRLDDHQLVVLLQKIHSDALVSPDVLLPMLKRSTTHQTSSVVIGYLEDAVRSGWRPSPDVVAPFVKQLPDQDGRRLQASLQTALNSAPQMQSRLAEYLPLLEGGDVERGRTVFFSSKVACATCHQVGSQGGRIGPDLTHIGEVRAGRDIVESILFPSSTIAQGFEQYAVVTTDGRTISGVMAREAAETIALRDSSGAETRLRRDQVEDIRRQTVSIMPERLERQLSPQEFRDLLRYLQSLR
jgi:putative heme-binding domain-containing protein